jgi:uncharacterized metal-binding protein
VLENPPQDVGLLELNECNAIVQNITMTRIGAAFNITHVIKTMQLIVFKGWSRARLTLCPIVYMYTLSMKDVIIKGFRRHSFSLKT